MLKKVSYDMNKFFEAIERVEAIPDETLTMRDRIATIISLLTNDVPMSSDILENISYDDIENTKMEIKKFNEDQPLVGGDDNPNNNHIITEMVFVEHAKDNLIAAKPQSNTNNRNLF